MFNIFAQKNQDSAEALVVETPKKDPPILRNDNSFDIQASGNETIGSTAGEYASKPQALSLRPSDEVTAALIHSAVHG